MDIRYSKGGKFLTREEAVDLIIKGSRVNVSPVDDRGTPSYGLGVTVKVGRSATVGRRAWITPATGNVCAMDAKKLARSLEHAALVADEADRRLASA